MPPAATSAVAPPMNNARREILRWGASVLAAPDAAIVGWNELDMNVGASLPVCWAGVSVTGICAATSGSVKERTGYGLGLPPPWLSSAGMLRFQPCSKACTSAMHEGGRSSGDFDSPWRMA